MSLRLLRVHQQGVVKWQSEKAAAAVSPTWDLSHKPCEFPVEALETSGTLLLEVFQEVCPNTTYYLPFVLYSV
jgi:hypothetical protein